MRSDNSLEDSPSISAGVLVVCANLKSLPKKPGVYRMIDSKSNVLYVGKAKNLKKRVSAYVNPERLSVRIQRMISQTTSMEFVTTHTEVEALLLEANLIKRFTPKYNILLRDDKSFPHILITRDHSYPRVLKHRGSQNRKGNYFGPFASVWAVNETLSVLQRAFLLRSCTDTVFANRTRPCLLYQINRCAAPCVNKINEDDYSSLVNEAQEFLTGNSQKIQKRFAKLMQAASDDQEFELAAQYRDRIRALTRIQAHQDINFSDSINADIIAAAQDGEVTCIQVFFFRSGTNFGNRAYFPSQARSEDIATVIEAFLGQFYARVLPPKKIFLSHEITNHGLIEQALSVRAKKNIKILVPKRGTKRNLIKHATSNAYQALERRLSESATQRRIFESLAEQLGIESAPNRIEVYDNSHVSGSHAVGVMIVVGPEGFIKGAYRKFNLSAVKFDRTKSVKRNENSVQSVGDDYAMMREVLSRRFKRAIKEDTSREQWPDLVLLDGGKGHLSIAKGVFAELGIENVTLAAIAKGPKRNDGKETVFQVDRKPLILKPRDTVSYFLQRIRDEAHRFAIGSHRQKRSKSIKRSILDDIPGIGSSRKKALLRHFGDARAIAEAGIIDLEIVNGISKSMAKRIYGWFHDNG